MKGADRLLSFFRRMIRPARRRRSDRMRCELLEPRTLLASVTDSGATLQIELEGDERLQIVSNGGSYDFTSTNSVFSNSGVTDPGDFSGFGTSSLTLNDLAQYSQVQIVDAAAGASVEFVDSETESYHHDFLITLDNGAAAQAVLFNGKNSFGDHSITATVDGAIKLLSGSHLSVVNGNIALNASNQTDGTVERRGIDIVGATVATSGTGNISLTGHGAANAPTLGNLDGMAITAGSRIESTSTAVGAGTIEINGTGGGGADFESGVWIADSVVSSVMGAMTVTGRGGDGIGHSHYGISARTATFESTGAGADAATVTLDGNGGAAASFAIGLALTQESNVRSQDGNIVINGVGGDGADLSNDGVDIRGGSEVRSLGTGTSAAEIRIDGSAGNGTNWNDGLHVHSATVSSVVGDITLIGRGGEGTGHGNRGIALVGSYRIQSTGTGADAADILLDGDGGPGTAFNYGVSANADESLPSILSHDGHITVTGDSSRLATTHSNFGVLVNSLIQSTGDGRLTIDGHGGGGTGFNRGVVVNGRIESANGRLNITGDGGFGTENENEGVVIAENAVVASTSAPIVVDGDAGGNNSHGVEIWGTAESGGQILSRDSADILIHATGGAPDGGRAGTKDELHLYQNSFIGGANSTGDISIRANTVTLDPASEIRSLGSFQIAPYQHSDRNRTITIGGADQRLRTDLHLTAAEIQTFDNGFDTITIGNRSTSGAVMTINEISLASPTEFHSAIIHNAVASAIGIADVSLYGTIAPGSSTGILPLQNAALKSDSVLRLEFGGTTPGDGRGFHDQIDASGPLGIQADVELQSIWLPSWKPKGGEQLTVVKRQGGSGTFANLPEGATLSDFFNATISYVGGDGDDIVLTLPETVAISREAILNQLGADALTIFGADSIDMAGGSVRSAGDVNGDGFDDILIGADHGRGSANELDLAGEAYLVYGSATPLSTIDLANLGDRGITFFAANQGDHTGRHLSGGDFNGDGYSDILISADRRDGNNDASDAGGVYLVWGGPMLPSTMELGSLGAAGVTIVGLDANDKAGHSVSRLGDVNNDGIEDFAIGAKDGDGPANEGADHGEVYVVFGAEEFPDQVDLQTATAGVLTIFGADAFDRAGSSIDALGDVNGDGIDDFGIGAPGSHGPNDNQATGAAFIVYGRESFAASMDLSSDADVVFYGTNEFDQVGLPISGGGDVNGDGFADILLGANGADSVDEARPWAGETHLIWGRADLPAVVHTGQLGDLGVTIYGEHENDFSGRSVDIVGDLNDDGYADLVIGAHRADGIPNNIIDTDTGKVYVILGGDDFPASIDLREPDAVDFTLIGELGDEAGVSVQCAGDIDGDGLADFLVGADESESFNDARSFAGEAYVIYGDSLFLPAVPLVTRPANGARLTDESVTITWRESADAVSYELWLEEIGGDNNPIANPTTSDTHFEWTNSQTGRFRAWVRANKSDGSRSAWTTSTFSVELQTIIEDLPDHADGNLRPTVSWDSVPGATRYRVYINNVTQQQNGIVDTIVSGTDFSPNFDFTFGVHRIWVQPFSSGNFAGRWSAAADYFVGPQLLSPTSTLSHQPTFSWSDVPGLDTVQLYVQRGSEVVINESGLNGTMFTPDFLAEGSYRWWVRGFAANGRGGRWSRTGRFNIGGSTIITGPTAVVANGLPEITWQPVDGATEYELYLYSDSDSTIVQRTYDLTDTTFQSMPLADGDYRVWIRSYVNGTAIRWSRGHSFTVAASAPALSATPVSPLTPTFEPAPTFTWNADADAVSFNLYLKSEQLNYVIVESGITDTQWTTPSPLAGQVDWWVQPVNAAGEYGAWSEKAATDVSGRAIVLEPILTGNPPTFRWTEVGGANVYVLQVNNIATGEQVIREDQLQENQFTPPSALPAGNYRIWVRAIQGDNHAPWSFHRDVTI